MESSKQIITDFEPGMVVADRYEVVQVLGSGAMGRVLKVIDRSLDNDTIALKLLYPHLVEDQVLFGRFRNEVLVARKLAHPNIVRLYDFGSAGKNLYFISMEYVHGFTLSERSFNPSQAPLTFNEVLRILAQVARGLDHAHKSKVIHRDLKPDNVMLSKSGDVKIADFGLARSLLLNKGFTQSY